MARPLICPMANEKSLKIAVFSDIHAHIGRSVSSPGPSSWIDDRSVSRDHVSPNPIHDLHGLIQTGSLKVDLAICCGDICDIASPGGLDYGWTEFVRLADALGAVPIGINGNHDIDSRHVHSEIAYEKVRGLLPKMPIDCDVCHAEYFSNKYLFLENSAARILLVDSCSYHPEQAQEQGRGRIPDQTLHRIADELAATKDTSRINICVTHHHPVRISKVFLGQDYDCMVNGAELINMLQKSNTGDWLIVHGHKHYPFLRHAKGTTPKIALLSSGSLSHRLWPELLTVARNQFHIIDISIQGPMGQVGIVHTWTWQYGSGWTPANQNDGLPYRTGLGIPAEVGAIHKRILEFAGSERSSIRWRELEGLIPVLQYLSPDDLTALKALLEKDHWHSMPADRSIPHEISKAEL